MIYTKYINTPISSLEITSDENFILSVQFKNQQSDMQNEYIPSVLENAAIQLEEYIHGKRKHFDLALNPSGTPFQKRVWEELLKISFGKTCSYRDLAIELGDVKTIRAAAAANGKNPIAIIIPCHRVIGSNGSLTGFSGGLAAKKWLLELEEKHHLGIQKLF